MYDWDHEISAGFEDDLQFVDELHSKPVSLALSHNRHCLPWPDGDQHGFDPPGLRLEHG